MTMKEKNHVNLYLRYRKTVKNFITNGLSKAENDDLILISDVDESNLENLDLKISEKIILFTRYVYYKFNLKLPNLIWTGTKACKKTSRITSMVKKY